MNKTDFMIMVAKNIHDMQELKLKYKYSYNHYDRSQFYDIARKINRYSKVDVPESKTPIDERKINENFLLSLEKLDNDYIYDYFQRILKGIKIEKKKCIYSDEAELEYEIAKNQPTKFLIYLPKTKLTITNQIGFAHEMGHIPEIDVPRNTFFEYNETIPMFFEYISSLDCYGKENGRDNFLCERLSMNLINAYNMLRFFKKCDIKDETISLYYTQLFADDYKFLESLDYTLQLIDIYEKDKKIVIDELENVIRGKSLNDVSSDLDIDTSKCKRLLKEYKGDQR